VVPAARFVPPEGYLPASSRTASLQPLPPCRSRSLRPCPRHPLPDGESRRGGRRLRGLAPPSGPYSVSVVSDDHEADPPMGFVPLRGSSSRPELHAPSRSAVTHAWATVPSSVPHPFRPRTAETASRQATRGGCNRTWGRPHLVRLVSGDLSLHRPALALVFPDTPFDGPGLESERLPCGWACGVRFGRDPSGDDSLYRGEPHRVSVPGVYPEPRFVSGVGLPRRRHAPPWGS